MNKLQMAHEYFMKHGRNNSWMESDAIDAWKYADAMQAEEDKRKVSGVPEAIRENSHIFGSPAPVRPFLTKDKDGNCTHFHHEFGHKKCMDCGACLEQWQPDWSQAPDWAVAWAMDMSGECYWHSGSREPKVDNHIFESSADGHTFEAPSFGYKGKWKESLRKRP